MSRVFSAGGSYLSQDDRGRKNSQHSGGLHTRNFIENLLILRETERLELRENSLPIYGDFKCTAMTLDERCNDTKFIFDCGLQTCSLR